MPARILAVFALLTWVGAVSAAQTNLSAGVWAVYENVRDNDRDEETFGDIKDEALILYMDGHADPEEGAWSYSAELRIGPGSFTDPGNNSTGNNFALHKAWVGFSLGDRHVLRVGKSQVPFGWKTVNFWPGDVLQAGYGDQMDVGFKLTGTAAPLKYDLAYYHADDWGETSTDTVDDNGHWGSASTYRKVQTVVGNIEWTPVEGQTIALSAQRGRLQDLTGTNPEDPVDGDHFAAVLWYHGVFGPFYTKLELITGERELPPNLVASVAGLADTIENDRIAAEFGYRRGDWFWYLDASLADPGTRGNNVDTVAAFAPGVSWDYGPGWIYFEYLTQDGFVDANGQVGEGDFDALYIAMDFYL